MNSERRRIVWPKNSLLKVDSGQMASRFSRAARSSRSGAKTVSGRGG